MMNKWCFKQMVRMGGLALGLLLFQGCSRQPSSPVWLKLAAIPSATSFTMSELTDQACDHFYVLPPYALAQLEKSSLEISPALRSVAKTNMTAHEELATIFFVKGQKVVAYAEVSQEKADFREFPALQGFSMQQPLQRNAQGKVVIVGNESPSP